MTIIQEVLRSILQNLEATQNFNANQTKFIHQIVTDSIANSGLSIDKRIDSLSQQLVQSINFSSSKIENMNQMLENKFHQLQTENSKKLEHIRATVEEKLESTLEKRLAQSFSLVSERLEMVYKGLGEMQNLASGVGDLKKVLTNVKTRGMWGEAQIDAILKQVLTPEQYIYNAKIRPSSEDRVEYAIKLPGKHGEEHVILLPIDAKFPLSDYEKLIAAQESQNLKETEHQMKALERSIKNSAKQISEKYIHPPYTTDFAIMFLPLESLYAEVLRKPGLLEQIQQEYRVIITSPTTFSAILNSLYMGFKTLMIERRSSEIWQLLELIRVEFIKFAELLTKTKTKLDQAGQAISDAEGKTRSIQQKLQNLERPELISIEKKGV